jgi:benzoyl-CoA reductase subunit B
MTVMTEELAGRGMREGKQLFAEWFQDLTVRAGAGERAAYVFVMGSMAEVLRSFDIPLVFPEINSLQTAVKKVSGEYLGAAEDYGYSPDICGYVKADVAVQLQDGRHPMGQIPKPSVAVLTNACNTYIKWGEIWERLYGVPIFTLDVPTSRSAPTGGGPAFISAGDRAYVRHQIGELIRLCEELTGRSFDPERFREVLHHTNQMTRSWVRMLELNRQTPAVFDALAEGTIYLGVANALRGTAEGAEYFRRVVEELEHKAASGLGTIAEERHRLVFLGVPCYPIFRRFFDLFAEWGGVFVSSTYLWFAAGGMNLGFEYDLDDPLDSLAEGVLRSVRSATDSMIFHDRALLSTIDDFAVDGVVYHPVKSCRTVSTGLADSRRAVLQHRDVQSLFIESDMMDGRVVSEAQLKNRIDAFFEGLDSRRIRRAAASAAVEVAATV